MLQNPAASNHVKACITWRSSTQLYIIRRNHTWLFSVKGEDVVTRALVEVAPFVAVYGTE